jgi:hypothetical protein
LLHQCLFPDAVYATTVLLPESFRGGCSFGAGLKGPVSPDVTVFHIGGKHGRVKPVNAAMVAINRRSKRLQQVHDLLAQFLDTDGPLV